MEEKLSIEYFKTHKDYNVFAKVITHKIFMLSLVPIRSYKFAVFLNDNFKGHFSTVNDLNNLIKGIEK